MKHEVRTLFRDGKEYGGKKVSLSSVIGELRGKREFLHDLPIEDILDFFDEAVRWWQEHGIARRVRYSKNISDFLRRETLTEKLRLALRGDYTVLDEFRDLGDPQFLFHAQPRGLVVEWLAGNVPVLGLFSICSALITKNVCLAKASEKGYGDLVSFVETFGHIETDAIKGKDLFGAAAVILVDDSDRTVHEALSENADVRMAWGGRSAIEAIASLNKNTFCEDIIFGPKYSYAIIDKESLDAAFSKWAQRCALDVATFDQYACSSPHTVFVQEGATHSPLLFAEELAKQLDLVQRTLLPKEQTDPATASEIVRLRARHALTGKVFSSKGTEWTVIYSEEEGLADACGSRVIFVKPLRDFKTLVSYNDRGKQTLGVAMTKENKLRYLDALTFYGVDRCPDFGSLTFFESPWDGMFIFDRLVRWVTIHK